MPNFQELFPYPVLSGHRGAAAVFCEAWQGSLHIVLRNRNEFTATASTCRKTSDASRVKTSGKPPLTHPVFRPPPPHQAASPNSFLSVSLVEDRSACAARCAPNTLGCGIEASSPHPLLPPVRFTHGAQGPVASSLSTLYSAPCAHHQPRQAAAANSFLSVALVEGRPACAARCAPNPPG